ncbi:MAG: NAD(P)/FAD-dependent oxidoreductase [Planctomycetota bacterium]|jgi:sarcosine oxidase subunit beta
MGRSFDAVIIGGGIMGAWIALELAQRGAGEILLLEKSSPGAGSSGKSGAILRQHYSHPTSICMARHSLDRYARFEEEFGIDIGFHRTGMVFIAGADSAADIEENVALQRQHGVDASVIGADELQELEPTGRFTEGECAAWEPEAGYVHPLRAVYGCLEVAMREGVTVRTGVAVRSIEVVQGRASAVRLDDGERVEAGHIINAAGPWARKLLEPHAGDLPLRAIRPEQAYFEPPSGSIEKRTIYGDMVTGLYWKPEAAGWTRVGCLSFDADPEVDPDHYDEGVDGRFIQRCRARLSERLPHYRRSASWGGCGALYTVTPDARAIIGPVAGIAGLTLVSGFSGHGFKMGPAVGCGVAGMVTGTETGPLEPEFFTVDRFSRVSTQGGRYSFGILG